MEHFRQGDPMGGQAFPARVIWLLLGRQSERGKNWVAERPLGDCYSNSRRNDEAVNQEEAVSTRGGN